MLKIGGRAWRTAMAVLVGCYANLAHAAEVGWADMGLQDLMNVNVESASRKQQTISDTAAAIHVITADDIKRSGALVLPEVLRLAPGVEAARISNNKWAVSIRGFNGRMANKLLVMVDGRSIYSSLYGGVIWEAEDIPLSEIERIEVIRGSAGVAWGSNAVNGVVNIITRRSQDTQGWLADGHIGTSTGKAGGVLRYGTKLEDGSALRVTVNDQKRDGGKELNGRDAQDQWNDTSLSFRYDHPQEADTHWFASGKAYDSRSGEPWLVPTFNTGLMYDPARFGPSQLVPYIAEHKGGSLLGRLDTVTQGGGEVRVQAYVERYRGYVPAVIDDRTTADLDAQHHFLLSTNHDFVWGGNYRETRHRETLAPLGFLTAQQSDVRVNLVSVFAQDDWSVVPQKLNMQAGLRVEHQTYGGTAPEPSVKGLWKVDTHHILWAGWSRMVRSPSMVEEAFGANPQAIPATGNAPPVLVRAGPGSQSGFGNEKARTIELGYRGQMSPSFSTDLVAYKSDYSGIFGAFPGGATTTTLSDPACAAAFAAYGLAPGTFGVCQNITRGNIYPVRTHGVELALEWRPLPYWRLQMNASRMWLGGGSLETSAIIYGTSPRYQGSLRSSVDIGSTQRFDLWWRRTGGLAGRGNLAWPAAALPIQARTELDLRYAVQAAKSLELAIVGQNLLSSQQLQFYADYMPNLPVIPQRTVYLQAVWRDN